MMMMFGSGDIYPEKHNCSGPRVAFVMIHCNHNRSSEVGLLMNRFHVNNFSSHICPKIMIHNSFYDFRIL